MKIQNFEEAQIVSSTLKVVASESLDVSEDLKNNQDKTIAELINDKKEKEEVEPSEE